MNKDYKIIFWFAAGLIIGVVLTLGITWFLSGLQNSRSEPNQDAYKENEIPLVSISPAPLLSDFPTKPTESASKPQPSGSDARPTEPALEPQPSGSDARPTEPALEPQPSGSDTKPTEPASEPKPTGSATRPVESKPVSIPSDDDTLAAPEWNPSTAYTGGCRVIYQDSLYEAKWWTQNEVPGASSGVWTYIATLPKDPSSSGTSSDSDLEDEQPVQRPEVSEDDFKVVAYYPSWKTNQLGKVRFDIITHVIYAFAIPCSDGSLRPLENPETAKALIEKAHKNGAKALIAVGGWSYNDVPLEPTFKEATATKDKVQKLGDAILKLCNEYGFDGVDIDWEHPRVDDTSHSQYEQLMVYLGKKLHADGKLLTSAVLSGATPDGGIYYDAAAHSDKVLETIDFLNVMAYDGGDGERHSSYDFAVACGTYWQETRGMEASRVVLGVPFYGRPSWSSYEDILALNPDAWKGDVSDVYGMSAWYNGIETIKKKTSYAAKHLGGIMIWEITQDTSNLKRSLLTAIGEAAAAH